MSHCDRCGFDVIYPPHCPNDEDATAALQSKYSSYLDIATQLYSDMSLTGSRRKSTNCGSHAVTAVTNARANGDGGLDVASLPLTGLLASMAGRWRWRRRQPHPDAQAL